MATPSKKRKTLPMPQLFLRAGFLSFDGMVFDALKTPDLNITEIAETAGSHRPAVYASLKRLMAAALVIQTTKGKRTVYRRGSANKLRSILKNATHETEDAIRTLDAPYEALSDNVRILSGKEGLRSVLELMLERIPRNGLFYRYSSRSSDLNIDSYMPESYRTLRDAKRIQQFVIVNDRLRRGSWKKRLDASSKVVPVKEDPFEYGVNVLIFDDKVAFVNFIEERAYLITDKKVADMQRGIFKLLYHRLEL